MFFLQYPCFYHFPSQFFNELVGWYFHGAVECALSTEGTGEKARFEADFFISQVTAEDHSSTAQMAAVPELITHNIIYWAGYYAASAADAK